MATNDLLRCLNSCNVAIAGRSFDVKVALFLETKLLFLFLFLLFTSYLSTCFCLLFSASLVTLRWLLRSYVHLKIFYSLLWDCIACIREPVEEKTNEAARMTDGCWVIRFTVKENQLDLLCADLRKWERHLMKLYRSRIVKRTTLYLDKILKL